MLSDWFELCANEIWILYLARSRVMANHAENNRDEEEGCYRRE